MDLADQSVISIDSILRRQARQPMIAMPK